MWEEGYRDTFITIWHNDPGGEGSDDSCGWAYPRLTRQQRNILKNVCWVEAHNPHFLCHGGKEWTGTVVEAEMLHRGLALLVNRVLKLKLSWAQICQYAAERTHINDGVGKAGDTFCFRPGYHTNNQADTQFGREDHFHGILCIVARSLLDIKRPWWRHPRWHFWHWSFTCRPLVDFKRWAFSRCCKCGGRFRWGYAPVTSQWHGTGPLWFRSEQHVHHASCLHPDKDCVAESKEAA